MFGELVSKAEPYGHLDHKVSFVKWLGMNLWQMHDHLMEILLAQSLRNTTLTKTIVRVNFGKWKCILVNQHLLVSGICIQFSCSSSKQFQNKLENLMVTC